MDPTRGLDFPSHCTKVTQTYRYKTPRLFWKVTRFSVISDSAIAEEMHEKDGIHELLSSMALGETAAQVSVHLIYFRQFGLLSLPGFPFV